MTVLHRTDSTAAGLPGGDGIGHPFSPLAEALLARLPEPVHRSLNPEQKAALHAAAGAQGWRHHPIDIRLSIPGFGRRYYLTVVAGRERRSDRRRRDDRRRQPWRRLGNIIALAVASVAFYGAATLALLFYSSVLTF